MMDSTGRSGRDEQRVAWNGHARKIAQETTTASGRILGLGYQGYGEVIDSVAATIRAAGDGLTTERQP